LQKKGIEEAQDIQAKKQATVAGTFSRHTEARHARNVAVFDLVEAFTEANIPGKVNIHGKVGSSQHTLILTEPHSKPWFIA